MRPCLLSFSFRLSVKPFRYTSVARFSLVKSLPFHILGFDFALRLHHVNDLFTFLVVPGRLELPTSTLSV